MDINQLRVLVAIDDTGSMTAAASLLDVTQPAISRAVRRLEAAVSTPLVLPRGRGIQLTPAGRRLAVQARPVLASFDALAAHRGEPAGAAMRIGSYEPWSTWFVPDALHAAGIERADIVELVPGDLEAALVASRIDVAVTAHAVPRREIEFHRIARVRTVVATGTGAKAEQLPWVAPFDSVDGVISARAGLDGWPAHRAREVAFRVTMLQTALTICRRGQAQALLPAPLVAAWNAHAPARDRLVPCRTTGALPVLDLQVAHRADTPLDSEALDLSAELRSLLASG